MRIPIANGTILICLNMSDRYSTLSAEDNGHSGNYESPKF